MNKKNITLIVLAIIVIGLGIYLFVGGFFDLTGTSTDTGQTDTPTETVGEEEDAGDEQGDTEAAEEAQTIIGTSVEGRDIVAYHYGEGDKEVLFIGAIHGGYEWNTALVARELRHYLEDSPSVVPDNVRATVIPVLNPDGLHEIFGVATDDFNASDAPDQQATIPGRFNANNVDVNRNFDCNWQSTGVWQDRQVDAGDEPFSEPESRALRDYVLANDIAGAVVYYSAAGGVYTSSCNNTPSAETVALMNTYANASGYPAEGEFDAYEITGDAVNWMAKQGIPGISVLLSNHQDVEWDKNRVGVEAVFGYFATN